VLVRLLALAAQMDGRLHAGLSMFRQKLQKVVSFYKVQLARLAGFRSRRVRNSRNSCVQPQHLARLRDLENESLAFARSGRQLHSTLAQNLNAAAWLTFVEPSCTSRKYQRELYLLKRFHVRLRQTTEKAFGTKFAGEAVFYQLHPVRRVHCALPIHGPGLLQNPWRWKGGNSTLLCGGRPPGTLPL